MKNETTSVTEIACFNCSFVVIDKSKLYCVWFERNVTNNPCENFVALENLWEATKKLKEKHAQEKERSIPSELKDLGIT